MGRHVPIDQKRFDNLPILPGASQIARARTSFVSKMRYGFDKTGGRQANVVGLGRLQSRGA